MPDKTLTAKQTRESAQKRETAKPVAQVQQADLGILQRAVADPRVARPSDILALQRTVGNRAVSRLIQTKLTVGPANDHYEQEADRMAEQVLSMPVPRSAPPSVQRATEEEEVQAKPLAASITPLVQRQGPPEEEELFQDKRVSVADGSESETIQRYSDFNRAPGRPQSDYKVMSGDNRAVMDDFGDYHIKFHNIKGLGVFDEFHIAFEEQPRGIGYFFYDDSGNVIPDKSSGLKATRKRGRRGTYIDAARAEARWFVSQTVPVPDEEVEQALKQKERGEAEAKARQEQESRLTDKQRRERASASASKFGTGTKYVPPHLRRKPLFAPLTPLV